LDDKRLEGPGRRLAWALGPSSYRLEGREKFVRRKNCYRYGPDTHDNQRTIPAPF